MPSTAQQSYKYINTQIAPFSIREQIQNCIQSHQQRARAHLSSQNDPRALEISETSASGIPKYQFFSPPSIRSIDTECKISTIYKNIPAACPELESGAEGDGGLVPSPCHLH